MRLQLTPSSHGIVWKNFADRSCHLSECAATIVVKCRAIDQHHKAQHPAARAANSSQVCVLDSSTITITQLADVLHTSEATRYDQTPTGWFQTLES